MVERIWLGNKIYELENHKGGPGPQEDKYYFAATFSCTCHHMALTMFQETEVKDYKP